MTIQEMKEVKRELTKHVFNLNDYAVNYYFNDYNKFLDEIKKYMKTNLALLTMKEIKALNFINRINEFDLEFIIKEC